MVRDSITFTRVVRVELFGTMSGEESVEKRLIVRWGAIPQSCDRVRDSVTLAGIEEVMMLGATGGASSSPTKRRR